MKQTVYRDDFINAFMQVRPDNFSREGLDALFDYLEQLEEDSGTEYDLDVIAICCGYSEYANMDEFRANYGDAYQTIDDVENKTVVIRVDDDRFIVLDF